MWLRCFSRKKFLNFSLRAMSKRFKTDKSTDKEINTNDNKNKMSSSQNAITINNRPSLNSFTYLAPPTKSQSDVKDYSVIKLSNGLTALLISDKSDKGLLNPDDLIRNEISDESDEESVSSSDEEESVYEDHHHGMSSCNEKLAACALSVGVGSFSDPEEIPGLAHFLEHMIFMGSEKYPKENEFDVYIKKKGGSNNASTECEFTSYYFDCHETHLYGAMEIFSQLFISPLMLRDSMTKEREAIESEFQMSLPSDESRRSQLLCSLAHNSNPAHKFLWGNLVTLRDNITDDELYKAVHEFRERHYSAHRMTLAVQARLPLETLEDWVNECFKNIPNNGLPPDKFELSVSPFRNEDFCKIYTVEPVKNINHLDITWVLPSTLKMYKTKPLNFLSWVIGHEGKGSLLSYLRDKLWCFDITVSGGGDGTEENSIYTLFTVSLILSEEGIQNIEHILTAVFEYIKMFKEAGPQERLFREVQKITEVSFRFSEEVSSSDNVEQLSENMQFYPSEDYITGMELYFEYDPETISSFLNYLKPDNVNIMISSKLAASKENLENIEPWFGTKYSTKEVPHNWLNQWKDIQSSGKFHLPEENKFISTNFSILPAPKIPQEIPQAIIKDDFMELWYKQDVTFKLPNAFCCLHFVSPLSHKTAQNAAMIDLFITILKQSLVEELYPANVAQLEYNFHSGEKGIVITVNGFNEKLKMLVEAILRGMMILCKTLSKDLFLVLKDELKRAYSNQILKPDFLARDIRMSILLESHRSALDKEEALEDVTLEVFKNFISKYFEYLFIQCLIQGNISREEALQYAELVKNIVLYKPLLPETKPEIRVNQLPVGEKYCIVKSFNTEDVNCIVTNYYQSGPGTIDESCIIELLLMIMEEPMFDSLRTKQQLGYDVSCTLRDTFGILGFSVCVHCQSDRNATEFVEVRITEFLKDFLQILKKYSDEDFKEIQESLIKLKKCIDVHLKEEVKRNWGEIKSEEYVFDRHHKEREIIEKLTLGNLSEWFETVGGIFDQSKMKKLSLQVVADHKFGTKKEMYNENEIKKKSLQFIFQNESSDRFILNLTEFKESLKLYSPHKIL